MSRTMKAVVYDAPGREHASLRQVPYPVCAADEAIVKVAVSGICKGADGDHDTTGTPQSSYPVTPGHEFGGVIAELGSAVTGWKVGERVTADPANFCGQCDSCREGKNAYCTDAHYMGHNLNGSFAEYVRVKAAKLYRVPENLSFDEISFAEPVSCCVHCIRRLDVKYGETVAVLGSGCSGIILAQLLRHAGAGRVIAIAGTQEKLDILARYGVETIRMDRNDYSFHESALRSLCPRGVDAVVEATGSPAMVSSGFRMLKPGGRLIQYALLREPLTLDMMPIWGGEKSYLTSCCEANDFPMAIQALAQGWVDVKPLITSRYPLDRYFEGLDEALHNHRNLKTLIVP
ncbi:MAG: zinc-binding dehydrogenase [Oscillospiraceae bacterium]